MSKTSKGTRLLRTRSGRNIGVNGQHLGNHSKRIVYNKPLRVQNPRVSPLITKLFLGCLVAIVAACIFAVAVSAQSDDPGVQIFGAEMVADDGCRLFNELRWFANGEVVFRLHSSGICPDIVDWKGSSTAGNLAEGTKYIDEPDEFLYWSTWEELSHGDVIQLETWYGGVQMPTTQATFLEGVYPVEVRYELATACSIYFIGENDPYFVASDGYTTYPAEHLTTDEWVSETYVFPNYPTVTWTVRTYNDEGLTQMRSEHVFGPFANPCFVPTATLTPTPTTTSTPTATPQGTLTPDGNPCYDLDVSYDEHGDNAFMIDLTGADGGIGEVYLNSERIISGTLENGHLTNRWPGPEEGTIALYSFDGFVNGQTHSECHREIIIGGTATPTPGSTVTPTATEDVCQNPGWNAEGQIWLHEQGIHIRIEGDQGYWWEGDTFDDGTFGPTNSIPVGVTLERISVEGFSNDQLIVSGLPYRAERKCDLRFIGVTIGGERMPTPTPEASPTPSRSINALARTGAQDDSFWNVVAALLFLVIVVIMYVWWRSSRRS